MTISPCVRCPLKADCSARVELRKKLKGLKLGSVKFRCEILKSHLAPGTWCNARFRYVYDDSTGRVDEAILPAVVARMRPDGKVVVYVPDDPVRWLQSIKDPESGGKVNWVAVRPDALTVIAGRELEPHCKRCGSPDIAEGGSYSCENCNPRDDYAGY